MKFLFICTPVYPSSKRPQIACLTVCEACRAIFRVILKPSTSKFWNSPDKPISIKRGFTSFMVVRRDGSGFLGTFSDRKCPIPYKRLAFVKHPIRHVSEAFLTGDLLFVLLFCSKKLVEKKNENNLKNLAVWLHAHLPFIPRFISWSYPGPTPCLYINDLIRARLLMILSPARSP